MLSCVHSNNCNSDTYNQGASRLEGREDKTEVFGFVVYLNQVKLLGLLENLMAL